VCGRNVKQKSSADARFTKKPTPLFTYPQKPRGAIFKEKLMVMIFPKSTKKHSVLGLAT
jgi:hypothetical protein